MEELSTHFIESFYKVVSVLGFVGSSLKNVMWLSPLRCAAQLIPPGGRILSGQRSTFSGYLTSGIMSGRHSTFSGYFTFLDGRGGQFNFPGQTCPDPLIYPESIRSQQFRFPGQLGSSDTRDSPDLFLPTIKKQTPIILTTKSPELSLIFNARYARQDIPKSSQSA